jgi:hypothetical protein
VEREGEAAWPALRSTGGDGGVWVGGVLLALAAVALGLAATRDVGPSMLLWAAVAAVLAGLGAAIFVWALAYRRLVYELGEWALQVRWLGQTLIVPYVAIDGIYTGQRLVGHAVPQVPCWPGIYVGPGRVRGIGRLRYFTTSPDPAALTLLTFEHGGVVLSARYPQEFRAALIRRVEGSQEGRSDNPSSVWTAPLGRAPWSALGDRWLPLSTAAGLVLLLGVLAVVIYGLPGLTDVIPLHFDASGQPSQIGPKIDLLRLPLFGLLLLALNVGLGMWAHVRDRLLARLLWVGGAVVQATVLVAVVRLLQ